MIAKVLWISVVGLFFNSFINIPHVCGLDETGNPTNTTHFENNLPGFSQTEPETTTTPLFLDTTSHPKVVNVSSTAKTERETEPLTTTTTTPEATTTTSPTKSTTATTTSNATSSTSTTSAAISTSSSTTATSTSTATTSAVAISPCIQFPCPSNSSCQITLEGRYCVCDGNFKGDNCNETDTLVQCEDRDTKLRYNATDTASGPIICFHHQSQKTSICQDPDDKLSYNLTSSFSGLFYLQDMPEKAKSCLYVNKSLILQEHYCMRISATEADDLVYRPWRMDSHKICVTFNIAPEFVTKNISVIINAKTTFKAGDLLTTLDVNDSFVSNGLTFKILESVPQSWNTIFRLEDSKLLLAEDLQGIKKTTVFLLCEVSDNGIPPLTDTTKVSVTFVNETLFCSAPPVVYVNILQTSGLNPIANLQCDGGTANVTFSVTSVSSDLQVNVDQKGEVSLGRDGLIAGTYNVVVMATRSPFGKYEISFSIEIGNPPQCSPLNPEGFTIEEAQPVGTCLQIADLCSLSTEMDVQFKNPNELTSKFKIVELGTNISLCLNSSLIGRNATENHTVELSVTNKYGNFVLTVKLTVVKSNLNRPVFNPTSYMTTLLETSVNGTSVLVTPATDGDGDTALQYYVLDDVPFQYPELTKPILILTHKLNATKKSLYRFSVIAVDGKRGDPKTRTGTALVIVNVDDVNEPPICPEELTFYVQDTAPGGYAIGNVSCFDMDRDGDKKQVSYKLETDSSVVKDLISVNTEGEITLIKAMTSEFNSYLFNVTATDGGGLSAIVNINISIKSPSPNCSPLNSEGVSIETAEAVGKCFEIAVLCSSSPLTSLRFKSPNNINSFFRLKASGSNISLCVNSSLLTTSPVGRHSIHIEVTNPFGKMDLTISLLVTSSNLFPPVFVKNPNNISRPEDIAVGSSIAQFVAVDKDVIAGNISYYVNGDVPFNFSEPSKPDLLVTQRLNATAENIYNVTVLAVDGKRGAPKTLTATATITISITDVNEAPVCPDELYFTVDATAVFGYTVGNFSCYDWDRTEIFRRLTYSIDQASNNNGMIAVSNTGELTLAKNMTAAKDVYKVEVNVSDGGGLSTNVLINILVNRYFAPVCPKPEVHITVGDNKNKSDCVMVDTACINPLGGNLQFTFTGGNGTKFFQILSTSKTGVISLCLLKSVQRQIGTWQIYLNVTNGFNNTEVLVAVNIVEVNDAPVFLSQTYNFTVTEKSPVNALIGTVRAMDPDIMSSNNVLTYELAQEGINKGLKMNSASGEITATKIFNASEESFISTTVKAKDPQGLGAVAQVEVRITDVNDPPVCGPVDDMSVALTTVVGTTVGQLNCWDSDLTSPFRDIVYEIQGDLNNVFKVKENGAIETKALIPRNISSTFVLNVFVMDAFMKLTGNTAGQLSMLITFNVNTNFPPSCNILKISEKLSELAVIGKCLPQMVICEDPTKGELTMKSQEGLESELEVRSNKQDSKSGLRMNVCTKSSLKGKIKTYTVKVTVTNGFGDAVVSWKIEVEDVNEAPSFKLQKYNITVKEDIGIGGKSILDITYNDPDTYPKFQAVNVSYKALSFGQGEAKVISFIQDCCFYVTGKLNATEKNLYQFEITLTDGGNLSTSTVVSIHIADVNNAPICNDGPVSLKGIPLMTTVNKIIGKVWCYDVDLDPENRVLLYADNSEYFKFTPEGDVVVEKQLPRLTQTHNVQVTVSDQGSPPLSAKPFIVTVSVDNKVPAECKPKVVYPQVWVKGQCVSLVMNCKDPTKPESDSHLSYITTGNYSSGFDLQNPKPGEYRLCYTQIQSGYFYLTVNVYNELDTFMYNQPLQVIYDQSNPQFTTNTYALNVSENVIKGTSVIAVKAETKSVNGSIVYSITGGSWLNISTIFEINSNSGVITTKLDNLRSMATQKVSIEVQALNDFSLLRSTATVQITVQDVNEAPTCKQLSAGTATVKVNDKVGVTIFSAKCTDVDVDVNNKRINAVLTSQPSVSGLFVLENNEGEIALKTGKAWPVKISSYNIKIAVFDAGIPSLSLSLAYNVTVNLLPPAPVLRSFPVNSSAIRVKWTFDRADYYDVTKKFKLTVTSGKEKPDFETELDRLTTEKVITTLQPETLYRVSLEAVTDYGSVSATPVNTATPAVPILDTSIMSMKLTGETFVAALYDIQSFVFVTLQKRVELNIISVLKVVKGFIDLKVTSFRPGSVIVDAVVTKNQSSSFTSISNTLQAAVQTGWVGNFSVDPNFFLNSSGDGYIKISSLVKNVSDVYQKMTLAITCTADIVGNVGTLQSVWTLDGAVINPKSNSRWRVIEEPVDKDFLYRRKYTLLIGSIIDKDSGNYSCIVRNNETLSDKKQLEVFVLAQPQVVIRPRTKTVREGDRVNVTCAVKHPVAPHYAYFIWYRNGVKFDAFSYETGENIVQKSTYEEFVVKENIRSSVQYSCEARNNAGIGNRAVADIRVIPKDDVKICPQEKDSYGFVWELSAADTKNVQQCLAGYSGTAERQCSEKGQWLKADYSGCVRNDLAKIAEETGKMLEGVAVSTPEGSLSQLANLTSSSKGALQTGDVDVSVTILDDVNRLAENDATQVTDSTIEAFAQTASNLLDDVNRPVWEWKKETHKKGLPRLMKAATDFGKISTKSGRLQQSGGLLKVKDNIVMQIKQVDANNDIVFPDNNLGNNPAWLKSKTTQVKIKSATLKALGGKQTFGQSAFYYKNVAELIDPVLYTDSNTASSISNLGINSDVVELSIVPANKALTPPLEALTPPLEVIFEHNSVNSSGPVCSFWDFTIKNIEDGGWSTKGCRLISTSNTWSKCECDHVTNFALLMSPGITPPAHELPLSIISAVGIGLSMLFLVVTIGTYLAFWRYVKSDRATILMHLCVALVLAYIIFLAGVNRTENKDACTAVAALLHYLFLVVFFLMLAEGTEMAFSVLYVFSTRSRIYWLLPLCWILPAVIVAISLGATELEGYGTSTFCWLSVESGLLWAFVGPALLVIIVNFIIFALVMYKLFHTHSMLTKTTKEQAKAGLRSMCVILPIMGITWVIGVFSVNEDLVIFQYLFAICNTLQGFFIFLFHCFLNTQMKDAIQHNNRRKRSLADFSKSTSQSINHKPSQKEKSETKQNNIDIEKKENPFLEADKQVQELLDKIHKVNDNNAYDASDDKHPAKDQVVGLDDIKIVNLFTGNDQSASSLPSSSNQNTQSHGGTIESQKKKNLYDQLDMNSKEQQYPNYDNIKKPAHLSRQLSPSEAREFQIALPNTETQELPVQTQLSLGSSGTRSTERYSLSNKSSNADDDLEIFFSLFDMSDSDLSDDSSIFSKERENRSRLDYVYSFSQEGSSGSKGSKGKKKEEFDQQMNGKQADSVQNNPKDELGRNSDEIQNPRPIKIYAPTIQKLNDTHIYLSENLTGQRMPNVQSREENMPRQRVPETQIPQKKLPRQRVSVIESHKENLPGQKMQDFQSHQENISRQRVPKTQIRQENLPRQQMPEHQSTQGNLSRQRMPEYQSSQGNLSLQRMPDVRPSETAARQRGLGESRQRSEILPERRAEKGVDSRQKYHQQAQARPQEPVYQVVKKSQKKRSSNWSKKDKDKGRTSSKERQRQHDRSRAYAVDYTYPSQPVHQPQARHTSLENISMQYVGFQPFGGIRSYDNIRPVQMDNYDYPMHWHDPSSGYW